MQKLEQDIQSLKSSLLEMGRRARHMVRDVLRALGERDGELLERVFTEEIDINRLQITIDREVIRLITIYGPAATDLRFLMMVARSTSDLERVGDLAVDMAEDAKLLVQDPEYVLRPDVTKMGNAAIDMVRRGLAALESGDAEVAHNTIEDDDVVDDLFDEIREDLIKEMMENPDAVRQCLAHLGVVRYLERVGDHATNICEEVIFVVEGRDIRHPSLGHCAPPESDESNPIR